MASCELLNSCEFFCNVLTDLQDETSYLVNKFCKGNYIMCARYRICQQYGRDKIPKGLYPEDGITSDNCPY